MKQINQPYWVQRVGQRLLVNRIVSKQFLSFLSVSNGLNHVCHQNGIPLCVLHQFYVCLCVCTCVCRSQCVGFELPCPFLLTLRESHGAHFNSERQAHINNSFPHCLPYFCMWYKCYSQSAGEGFGEMQEGYKESKNRGWQSLFRSSCFTLSIYSFSSFLSLRMHFLLFTHCLCSTYHHCADCFFWSQERSNTQIL